MPADIVAQGWFPSSAQPRFPEHLVVPDSHFVGAHKPRSGITEDRAFHRYPHDFINLPTTVDLMYGRVIEAKVGLL